MRADGGGDLRESVNESLHTVLNEINWDKDLLQENYASNRRCRASYRLS